MSVLNLDSYTFDVSVPVVIIGAGACGLTAALAARDYGAEVVVIEKDKVPRGTTSMSQGTVCAAGTIAQKDSGIHDDPETFYKDVMKKVNGQTDPELVKMVTSQAGPAIDWLTTAHEIPFQVDTSWKGLGHSVQRLHAPPEKSGEDLMGRLLLSAEKAGVVILNQAKVTDLYANNLGRVLGVKILRPGGREENIGLNSLVLATCGFANNSEMIKKYIPNMSDALVFTWENSMGDGIKWGMDLGASVSDMTAFQGYGALAYPHQLLFNYNYIIDGGVLVNKEGFRFSNEVADVSGQGVHVMNQKDNTAFMIYDKFLHEKYKHLNETSKAIEVGAVKHGDSLEEISKIFDLPIEAIKSTLDQINVFKKGEENDPWGRDFSEAHTLAPPYYAIRVTGALYHTLGGLDVNHRAQVKLKNGDVLPNLFAGGGVARGISGPTCSGYLPAAGLCMAITLGRIAGTSAAHNAMQKT